MSPVFISTAESGLRSGNNSDAAEAATPRRTARDDGWTNVVFLTNVEVVGHTRGEDFDTQRCIGSENLLELIMPDEEVVSLLQENENVRTERTSFDLDLHDLWLANEEEMLAEYAATLEDVQQQLAESRRQRTESRQQLAESRRQRTESRQQLAESRRQRTERRQQWTEMEQRVAKMEQQLLEIRQQLMETRQQLTETRQDLTETRQELTETRQELTETGQQLMETRQELAETGQDLTETWKELVQLSPESMIWSIARDKFADGLELLLPKTC